MARVKQSNVRALLRQLSKTMRFGGQEYAVEIAAIPEHERSWGKINTDKHVIHIDPDVPNGKRLAETVLHETVHGIWGSRFLPGTVQEEQAVEQLAAGLIAMFLDNPWMLPWLQAALRK